MRRVLLAAATMVLPLGAVSAPAAAGTADPFTITEHVNFAAPANNSFTATGDGLCPSGTFRDTRVGPKGDSRPLPKLNLLVRTVYTCADGSGSFSAKKHIFLVFGENSMTNSGPIQLRGGTGAYTKLAGHGIDSGIAQGDPLIGVGTITGFLTASAAARAGLS